MSTTSATMETSLDAIETISKDLRRAFNSGRTKPVAWRQKQLEQLFKMCDEQKDAFANAVYKDFHRPKGETLVFDCGSVSARKIPWQGFLRTSSHLDPQ